MFGLARIVVFGELSCQEQERCRRTQLSREVPTTTAAPAPHFHARNAEQLQ